MGRTEVILVDTHVVVWLAFDPHEISRKAKQAIEGARENGDGLAISDITLLELATLVSQGRIRLDISIESFLQEVESRFASALLSGGTPVRSNRNLLLTPVREQGNGNSLLSANENRIGSVHRY